MLSLFRLFSVSTVSLFFFFNDPATTEIYTLSLHDALPICFVGVSNFTGAMIAECMRTRRVDVSQVGYHMFDRRQEQETFPSCLTNGIGVMGYGSLGHGLLTGAFTAATTFGDPSRDWRGNGVAFGQPIFRGDNFKTNVGVVERLRREVAEPRGVPLSQIALAWVLSHPAISTALGGARTPAEGE